MENRRQKKARIQKVTIALFLAVMAFVFLLNSPLHPWIQSDANTDSSVFQTIALMMRKGYMPYRDSFDHKGPLLYILNYLGQNISAYNGIWFVEFVSLCITFGVLYEVAKIAKISDAQALIAEFIGISLLFHYFEGGNLTEEFALPFISIGIYIFLDYFINQKINKMRLMLCGFCLAGVSLLRANMIGVWIVFCIAVFIMCIATKNFIRICQFVIWFTIGFALLFLPIMIWLAVRGAFSEFLFDYIKFNSIYVSTEGGKALFAEKWNTFFAFGNSWVYTFAFICTIYLGVKRNRFFHGVYLCNLLLNLGLIAMSGLVYNHYGMVLIPLVVFPVAEIFEYCNENSGELVSFGFMAFLLCNVIVGQWENNASGIIRIYDDRKTDHFSEEIRAISQEVQKHTSEEDKISVYGNWDLVYIISEREHATRYSYQFPIGVVLPDIMESYYNEIEEEQPKVIVIQKGFFDEKMEQFLEKYQYENVWSADAAAPQNSHMVFEK